MTSNGARARLTERFFTTLFPEIVMDTHQNVASFPPTNQPGCSECRGRQEGFQIYTARVNDQTLLAWDVELAIQMCSDGRQAVSVHPAYLDELLRINRYDPAHLEHVDPSIPGIVCAIDYAEDLSPVFCLIDGTHRGALCRRDALPFFVYVLTDHESTLCQHTTKVALYRAVQAATPVPTR